MDISFNRLVAIDNWAKLGEFESLDLSLNSLESLEGFKYLNSLTRFVSYNDLVSLGDFRRL